MRKQAGFKRRRTLWSRDGGAESRALHPPGRGSEFAPRAARWTVTRALVMLRAEPRGALTAASLQSSRAPHDALDGAQDALTAPARLAHVGSSLREGASWPR
jgi:hypothetical protein